jgi:hypothetical protein
VALIVGELENHLKSSTQRDTRRRVLIAKLASVLQVPVESLTLGTAVDALAEHGAEVDSLRKLRLELRDAVAVVLKLNRRVATLARYHQGLFNEILGALADAAESADASSATGTLVDARV